MKNEEKPRKEATNEEIVNFLSAVMSKFEYHECMNFIKTQNGITTVTVSFVKHSIVYDNIGSTYKEMGDIMLKVIDGCVEVGFELIKMNTKIAPMGHANGAHITIEAIPFDTSWRTSPKTTVRLKSTGPEKQ